MIRKTKAIDPNQPIPVLAIHATLRDKFAGDALVVLLKADLRNGSWDPAALAADAYEAADAMIAARDWKKP